MGSGIRTFTNGEILTDTLLNGYFMQQVVVTCTSGTRPAAPTLGQPIYETDTKLIRVWDGSTWYCPASPDYVDWSASVRFYSNITTGTQIATGSVVVSYAKYQKVNTRVHFFGHATINTTTTNAFGIMLPFNVSGRIFAMGQVHLQGSGANNSTSLGNAVVPIISAPYNRITPVSSSNSFLNIQNSGDAVAWNITYESL